MIPMGIKAMNIPILLELYPQRPGRDPSFRSLLSSTNPQSPTLPLDIIVGFSSALQCEISVYLAYLTTYSDLMAVLPITADRVIAVFWPMRYVDCGDPNHWRV